MPTGGGVFGEMPGAEKSEGQYKGNGQRIAVHFLLVELGNRLMLRADLQISASIPHPPNLRNDRGGLP